MVEPLIPALKNEDCNVRLVAIFALVDVGEERAIESLIQTMNEDHENSKTIDAAQLALKQMEERRGKT